MPTYTLTRRQPDLSGLDAVRTEPWPAALEEETVERRPEQLEPIESSGAESSLHPERPQLQQTQSRNTIKSTLSESRYAVLPHGVSLDDWTPGEKAELNDHVRHMLHSKREGFKRSMKGFGQYVRRRKFRLAVVSSSIADLEVKLSASS